MELTGRDFDRIPRGNIRVPVVDFARLWLAAERALERDPMSWEFFGVAQTCRWLARATVRPGDGRAPHVAGAPVTRRSASAIAETIEEEALAADKLLFQRPKVEWLANRPGWLLAVHKTFMWAWYRRGEPPIEVPRSIPGGRD